MKRKTIILNSVLAVTAVGLVAFGVTSLGVEGTAAATETETTVRTGSVTQTVSATGNAIVAEDLTLNFRAGWHPHRGGCHRRTDRHRRPGAGAGRQHDRGEPAEDGTGEPLERAEARLEGILHPLTAQDAVKNQASVDQAQAAIDTAQTSLDNAKANLAEDTISQQNAVDRAKQSLANAQAVSSTGSVGQQSTLDQARQTLTDAASPPCGGRRRLDGQRRVRDR